MTTDREFMMSEIPRSSDHDKPAVIDEALEMCADRPTLWNYGRTQTKPQSPKHDVDWWRTKPTHVGFVRRMLRKFQLILLMGRDPLNAPIRRASNDSSNLSSARLPLPPDLQALQDAKEAYRKRFGTYPPMAKRLTPIEKQTTTLREAVATGAELIHHPKIPGVIFD